MKNHQSVVARSPSLSGKDDEAISTNDKDGLSHSEIAALISSFPDREGFHNARNDSQRVEK